MSESELEHRLRAAEANVKALMGLLELQRAQLEARESLGDAPLRARVAKLEQEIAALKVKVGLSPE